MHLAEGIAEAIGCLHGGAPPPTFTNVADWKTVLASSPEGPIDVYGPGHRLCDGIRRREFLKIGSLAYLGLSLPQVLRAEAAQPAA